MIVAEHAVIVNFKYGLANLNALRMVERDLERAIRRASVGEYDGDEIAVDLSHGSLWMYGPDADRLFAAIRPILMSVPFMKGAVVTLRYGGPDPDKTATITIGASHEA